MYHVAFYENHKCVIPLWDYTRWLVDGTWYKCLWDWKSIILNSQGLVPGQFVLGLLCCNVAEALMRKKVSELMGNRTFALCAKECQQAESLEITDTCKHIYNQSRSTLYNSVQHFIVQPWSFNHIWWKEYAKHIKWTTMLSVISLSTSISVQQNIPVPLPYQRESWYSLFTHVQDFWDFLKWLLLVVGLWFFQVSKLQCFLYQHRPPSLGQLLYVQYRVILTSLSVTDAAYFKMRNGLRNGLIPQTHRKWKNAFFNLMDEMTTSHTKYMNTTSHYNAVVV